MFQIFKPLRGLYSLRASDTRALKKMFLKRYMVYIMVRKEFIRPLLEGLFNFQCTVFSFSLFLFSFLRSEKEQTCARIFDNARRPSCIVKSLNYALWANPALNLGTYFLNIFLICFAMCKYLGCHLSIQHCPFYLFLNCRANNQGMFQSHHPGQQDAQQWRISVAKASNLICCDLRTSLIWSKGPIILINKRLSHEIEVLGLSNIISFPETNKTWCVKFILIW